MISLRKLIKLELWEKIQKHWKLRHVTSSNKNITKLQKFMFNLFLIKTKLTSNFVFHSSWSEFFGEREQPSNEGKDFYKNQNFTNLDHPAITASSDLYVCGCYFYSISFYGEGSAIYITSSDTYLLVEFSTFVDCVTYNDGYIKTYAGAIHFASELYALSHVCASECGSVNAFAYLKTEIVMVPFIKLQF